MVGSPFYVRVQLLHLLLGKAKDLIVNRQMAPELLLQKDFDEKVDVYSFGSYNPCGHAR